MYRMLQAILLMVVLMSYSAFAQTAGGGVKSSAPNTISSASVHFSGTSEDYFYSTTTYTFTDLVVFSYFDGSNFYVYNQSGTKIDSISLSNNQYHVFPTGTGIFTVECTESFTVLVGDPVSRNVLGFFAVDESGSPLSTRLNTYMPAHYTSGEHFIVFGYHDGTEYVVKNLQTSTIIAAGILNEGEHLELDGQTNVFIGVESNKPISALSYTDQGYFIPATNGTFAGMQFYGFSGYVGGWPNGIIVTGYDDDTSYLIKDTQSGDTLTSGLVNKGETFVYVVSGDTYYTVITDKSVTVSNTPYAAYTGSYYYLVRQVDETGLGIGTNFYAPVTSGQFDVFSFKDANSVNITAVSSGTVIWSGVLNENENYSFSCSHEIYHVTSSENVSVISSWGGSYGADFVPLNFALTLPDLAISSNEISFEPDSETRNPGEQITIKATVLNIGHQEANGVRVRFYDGDPAGGIAISGVFIISAIEAGGSADVAFDWVVPDYVEYHNIYVLVDKYDEIRESNESNNVAFKALIANNDLLPPLSTVVEAPASVVVDDQDVPEFDTFSVNVDLFNTGTVVANNAKVTITLPSNLALTDGSVETITWMSVDAGAHVDTSWSVQIVTVPTGDAFFYSILVEADDIESKVVERMLLVKRPTAIGNDDLQFDIPETFKLSQNFPNPFNPTTSFSLELNQSRTVLIEVYDIAGKKITELDKGMKPAGSYKYSFDGTGLVSGVYFLRMELDNREAAVRKMILLK